MRQIWRPFRSRSEFFLISGKGGKSGKIVEPTVLPGLDIPAQVNAEDDLVFKDHECPTRYTLRLAAIFCGEIDLRFFSEKRSSHRRGNGSRGITK